jgi:hypothetical protein
VTKYPHVNKVGSFKQSEIKTIQNIVQKVEIHFPDDIHSLADLVCKSVEQEFGKYFQVFMFEMLVDEGHCLSSTNGRHIVIEYKKYTYVIWQVLLDEVF